MKYIIVSFSVVFASFLATSAYCSSPDELEARVEAHVMSGKLGSSHTNTKVSKNDNSNDSKGSSSSPAAVKAAPLAEVAAVKIATAKVTVKPKVVVPPKPKSKR